MTPLLLAAFAAPLFTADLQVAVLQTEAGRAAKAELERAVAKSSAEAAASRDRLLARRDALSPETFEAERQRLNREVRAAEARLEARELALLDPILARLDALVAGVEATTGGRVVDVAPDRVAGQPEACDLTSALVGAFGGGPAVAISDARAEGCRPDVVVRVDAGPAVRGTPTARRIVAARDADRERLGAALEALAEKGGDLDRARALRAQIEARDAAARGALQAAVHRTMAALARRHPGSVWLAVDADRLAGVEGVCDGTSNVRRLLGGAPAEGGCRLEARDAADSKP